MNFIKNIKKLFKFIRRNTKEYVKVLRGKNWNPISADDDVRQVKKYRLVVTIMHIFPLVWCLFSVVVTFVMRNGNLIATFKNGDAFIYWAAVYFPVIIIIQFVLFIIFLTLSSKWHLCIQKYTKQHMVAFPLIVFPIISCVLLNFFASIVVIISLATMIAILCVISVLMNVWSRISSFIFGEPTMPNRNNFSSTNYDDYDYYDDEDYNNVGKNDYSDYDPKQAKKDADKAWVKTRQEEGHLGVIKHRKKQVAEAKQKLDDAEQDVARNEKENSEQWWMDHVKGIRDAAKNDYDKKCRLLDEANESYRIWKSMNYD